MFCMYSCMLYVGRGIESTCAQSCTLVEASPFHDTPLQSPQSRGKYLRGPCRRWLGRFPSNFGAGEFWYHLVFGVWRWLTHDPIMTIAILWQCILHSCWNCTSLYWFVCFAIMENYCLFFSIQFALTHAIWCGHVCRCLQLARTRWWTKWWRQQGKWHEQRHEVCKL